MMLQQIDLEDVYDLIGVRVITDSVKDCYAILGLVHSLWRPIPGKFKDYIAMPKPNMYQSLHTTVSGPNGQRVEVQIRTHEMHRVAEEGIAAHWQYKEEGVLTKNMDDHLSWVRRMLEDQEDIKNPRDFLNSFKVDLFFQEVYVFTPQGDVVALPRGATPVDFAYQVHTDIGNHCLAAKVNGKVVPLKYKLKNGDRLEILTSKQKFPSRDWLAFVKTSKARGKIANYLNSQEKAKSRDLGKDILESEVRKYGFSPSEVLQGKALDHAIHTCGYNSLDSLLMAIGYGKTPIHQVVAKLLPKETLEEHDKKYADLKASGKEPVGHFEQAIKVQDFQGNLMLRIGKCCNPIPGDRIVGYITRGRGISVHDANCPSVKSLANESERMINVEWDQESQTTFPTHISIVTEDKPGLLAKISNIMAHCEVNITRANVQQGAHQRAYFDLVIDIKNTSHLDRVFRELQKDPEVIFADRVKEYKRKSSEKGQIREKGGEAPKGQGAWVN
jgi:GTP pyrophosphokinase